jgi:ornithine decarboxylase
VLFRSPTIEEIGTAINAAIATLPDDVRVMAEPGRFLVADAGTLVCRVIGTTLRRGTPWAYIDAGMYSGLLETTTGIRFEMQTERSGEIVPWTLAGPTCDAMDICSQDQPLPADLEEGDFIFVRNAGAYSYACSSTFNGFPIIDRIVV